MLKFMVVLVRKAGMDRPEFKRYFKDVHRAAGAQDRWVEAVRAEFCCR